MTKRILMLFLVMAAIFIAGSALAADPNDAAGTKDPPLFSRMAGFHIYRSEVIDFGRFEFPVGANKKQTMEGRHYKVLYYANPGIKQPSGLQVVRNYANAARAIGGQQIYQFEDGGTEHVVLKVVRNGAEAWAFVAAASNGMYNVDIIERQAMAQSVVANAAAMAGSIRETGKVAIYGIYFDTGKSLIKPASEPSLREIAKLLQSDARLRVYIVGHTDTVGAFDANIRLSRDRADAVVRALSGKYGISASRMVGAGVGPLSPAASNLTEDGRAKNRRVELVAQ